jgi:hypothetical protein
MLNDLAQNLQTIHAEVERSESDSKRKLQKTIDEQEKTM